MATVVVHRKTGERYVLLGAGLGAWGAIYEYGPVGAISDLVRAERKTDPVPQPDPGEGSGDRTAIAVCDAQGDVRFFAPDDVRVESVDGKPPHFYLTREVPR